MQEAYKQKAQEVLEALRSIKAAGVAGIEVHTDFTGAVELVMEMFAPDEFPRDAAVFPDVVVVQATDADGRPKVFAGDRVDEAIEHLEVVLGPRCEKCGGQSFTPAPAPTDSGLLLICNICSQEPGPASGVRVE